MAPKKAKPKVGRETYPELLSFLELSADAYEEISSKLKAAGFDCIRRGYIDMHNIALVTGQEGTILPLDLDLRFDIPPPGIYTQSTAPEQPVAPPRPPDLSMATDARSIASFEDQVRDAERAMRRREMQIEEGKDD